MDIHRMLKIAVIEDNYDYRLVLKSEIDEQDDMVCVHDFGSIPAAMAVLPETPPNILILDLGLPKVDGLDAIPDLLAAMPAAKILVLTISENRSRVMQAMARGAHGYLLKTDPLARVIEGIRNTARGEVPMSPAIAEIILRVLRDQTPRNTKAALSAREVEVLQALADGQSRKIAAEQLHLSVHTINNHVRNIYEQLQVHNLSGALKKASEGGLI